MELLVTIAYFCLVWLIFYKYHFLRFNLLWKFMVFGVYALAVLTEVVLLGQTTPYSKELIVERYVIQLAPQFGGLVTEVHAKANEPIKKGEPIFSMDAQTWKERLQKATAELEASKHEQSAMEAELAEANRRLADALELVPKQVMAEQELEIRQDRVEGLKAQIAGIVSKQHGLETEVDKAKYNLDHAIIVAPVDGYLIDFQLRPGAFIRLKQAVATFVSSEELYLLASVDQRASQWIRSGDNAHFALSMYPGRIFKAKVDQVISATGRAQFLPSGVLPREEAIVPSDIFM